jgi:hypothetical protein
MLMEFSSRYIYEVLKEANVYRMHASRDELDVADIRLAVQCRTDACVSSSFLALTFGLLLELTRRCRSVTQPLPREGYSEIARLKNLSRLPLIPPSVEQQIPNFQRDARHAQDAAPAAADALRDSFTAFELYMRNHSTSASLKAPLPHPKQAQLSRADPSI